MLSLEALLILLGIPVKLFVLAIKALFGRGPYRKYRHQPLNTVKTMVMNAFLRLPVKDCKYVCCISNKTMINKLVGYPHHRLVLKQCPGFGQPYNASAIWLVRQPDRKPSDPVMIYLHGGGYYFEAGPSQIELTLAVYLVTQQALRSGSMSVLFLDYKLACRGFTLGTQLDELYKTYAQLCHEDGCENIYLMGDSAGGNLAISLLQYLHQNRSDPGVAKLPYPRKLVLISPWVKLVPDKCQNAPGHLWYDNRGRDIIEYEIFADMDRVKQITGAQSVDLVMYSPGNHVYSSDDWNCIPTLADENFDVCVIVGEDEVFRDDVLEWCKYALDCPLFDHHTYGNSQGVYDPAKHEYHRRDTPGHANVSVYIEPLGVHDSIMFFENHLLNKLELKPETPSTLDPNEFFAISRISEFLLS